LRTVTMQIPSQKIITKDNVSIDIAGHARILAAVFTRIESSGKTSGTRSARKSLRTMPSSRWTRFAISSKRRHATQRWSNPSHPFHISSVQCDV
jgi:hypothetical protein